MFRFDSYINIVEIFYVSYKTFITNFEAYLALHVKELCVYL